jgi:hypothetical protein
MGKPKYAATLPAIAIEADVAEAIGRVTGPGLIVTSAYVRHCLRRCLLADGYLRPPVATSGVHPSPQVQQGASGGV